MVFFTLKGIEGEVLCNILTSDYHRKNDATSTTRRQPPVTVSGAQTMIENKEINMSVKD